MRCPCPLHCRFCGAARRRDPVGHYCPTKNCQYQYGYAECTLHEKRQKATARVIDKIKKPTPSEKGTG